MRTRIKEATKSHDAKLVDLLLREDWCDYRLGRVPEGCLEVWWKKFCERCEPDTVNARLRVLRAAMKLAVRLLSPPCCSLRAKETDS